MKVFLAAILAIAAICGHASAQSKPWEPLAPDSPEIKEADKVVELTLCVKEAVIESQGDENILPLAIYENGQYSPAHAQEVYKSGLITGRKYVQQVKEYAPNVVKSINFQLDNRFRQEHPEYIKRAKAAVAEKCSPEEAAKLFV